MKRSRRKNAPAPQAPRPSLRQRWRLWFDAKAPLFQFCLKFCLLLVLFYLVSLLPVFQRGLSASLTVNARVAGAILDRLGENAQVTNATIWSSKYAVTVLPACSGAELLAFYCAMVIAFPSRLGRKVSGIVVGVLVLLALNQLRITSLFYVGAHFPKAFDATHEDVWGAGLILAEIVLCLAWIAWARESDDPAGDAAA